MIYRELGLAGAIAVVFGLASYYATGTAGAFAFVNLGAGALALAIAAIGGLRGLRGLGSPMSRRVLLPRLALLVVVIGVAAFLERGAMRLGWRLDWTTDQRFELSPATRSLLENLREPVEITFYRERGDARAKRTWTLLRGMAEDHEVVLHERWLDESEDEADQFGVQSTEAVVLQQGDHFETVDRPTEGTIYEALWRLQTPGMRTLYASFGQGEGDLQAVEPQGFSGLLQILDTEGYAVRNLITARGAEIPADAGAVLVVAPQRTFTPQAVASLSAYLARGGGLVALLEPGVQSGLEGLLAEYGFDLPDGVIIDPPSGPVAGGAAGMNPITSAYATHPVTQGLGPRTLAMFLEARPVLAARKPAPEDDLRALVFSSPSSWLAPVTVATLRGEPPTRPESEATQRWPFVAAGRYPRGDQESRILVFGDSSFADNGHLRALYNLDLVMNAIHWTLRREEAISIRPKILTPNQDPLTPQQSLSMLYGIGLLLPELLLIAGALAWIRRRAA